MDSFKAKPQPPLLSDRSKIDLTVIDTANGNGVLRRGLAAEVEGGDVDLAEDGAEGADETGFVEVVDEERHGMEVGFQGYALDFDDLGVAHVDHAGEAAPALAEAQPLEDYL